jgi:Acetyltransferase (GNAT) domain
MICIQGRAVVYGEVWFDEEPPRDAAVDILVYRYRQAPLPHAWPSPLHSLQTDLDAPPEAIAARFDETCRRQIRRAERQDGLRHEVLAEAADGLEEFADFYDVFARQKGLWLADRHWLSRAAEARQLALSCVSRDGERLVWHAHLTAGRTAQLAHSVSLFRGTDGDHRSLVARANRWLHWQDMLAFKAAGLRHYDWGGMFAEESTAEEAGVNRFKRTFGGRPVLAYECTVPVTLRGRVWLMIRGALRRPPKRPGPEAASAA